MIGETSGKVIYQGDGTVTTFPIPFRVLQDLEGVWNFLVIRTDINGVESLLVQNADYTVIVPDDTGYGISAVLSSAAPTVGEKITIAYNQTIEQQKSYIEIGKLPAKSIENALDLLTIIATQMNEEISRSVKVSASSSETPDGLLNDINNAVAVATSSASVASEAADVASASASSASASATAAQDAADAAAISGGFFKYRQLDPDSLELVTEGGVDFYGIADEAADITVPSADGQFALTLNDEASVALYQSSSGAWSQVKTLSAENGLLFSSQSDAHGYYWFADTWNLIDADIANKADISLDNITSEGFGVINDHAAPDLSNGESREWGVNHVETVPGVILATTTLASSLPRISFYIDGVKVIDAGKSANDADPFVLVMPIPKGVTWKIEGGTAGGAASPQTLIFYQLS